MSKSQYTGGEDGDPKGTIHIYIDNSNLWIQGQKTYAEVHNQRVSWNPKWRFDVGKVKTVLTRESELSPDQFNYNVKVNLYGSTPPPVDTVWKAIESHNVNVSTFAKSSFTSREKEVDQTIVADSVDEAADASHSGKHSVFMIVSGDRDLIQAIYKIIKRGFEVHVWSWKNSLAKIYDDPLNGMHVKYLDKHLEEIGFEENTFRVDRSAIGPESFVIFDPLRNEHSDACNKIENFIDSLRIPIYPYEMNRPGMPRPDLVVIPLEMGVDAFQTSTGMTLYQAAQEELKKHGIGVLMYQEYFRQYHKGSQKEPMLKISNRWKEFEVDVDTDEDNVGCSDASKPAEEVYESDDGFTPVREQTQQYNDRLRRDENMGRKRCNWGIYCRYGKNCKFAHTKKDEDYFRLLGPKRATKVNRCTREFCVAKTCDYAHSDDELFCPTCEGKGHQMDSCPKRNIGKSWGQRN